VRDRDGLSGIGLGIAEAGINVMLNGFGEAKEIERTRAALAEEYSITAPSTLLVEFDSAAGQNALYFDVTNWR
jgi:hypothetical protein